MVTTKLALWHDIQTKTNKNNDISAVTHLKKFGTLHNMVEYWIIEWVWSPIDIHL